MMPHPERAMEALLGSTDGVALFTSLASSLTAAGAAVRKVP
jgi:phosphoribosylformylglycinamidine (FGAM) synthase-like amidotransferase family enzyme